MLEEEWVCLGAVGTYVCGRSGYVWEQLVHMCVAGVGMYGQRGYMCG